MVARALIQRQSMLDFSGLSTAKFVEDIKAKLAVPLHWIALRTQATLFYTHQQWRSPSKTTAVGVVYVHLPFPLSGRTLLHLAEAEYSKKGKDGEVLTDWTDRYGRYWFEAQNDKYHGRGYILVDGLKAWVVYTGYQRHMPLDPVELALGERSLESVLPRGVVLAAGKAD